MKACKDNKIGNALLRGVSGGERKRTSIGNIIYITHILAYELISNPSIVILDEPTTGMDSFTSLVIMKYLAELAQTGKTIICTIHQPGSEIFPYINRMILLKDGYVAFQGKMEKALPFFSDLGYTLPEFCNPFDFFVDTIYREDVSGKMFNNKYLSIASPEVKEEQRFNHDKFASYGDIIERVQTLRRVNWFLELSLLSVRQLKDYIRNTSLFYARLAQTLSNTIILCIFFWDIGHAGPQAFFQNFTGFLFNCVNNFYINGMFTSILYIPSFKEILKREYSAKLYRISTFYLTQFLLLMVVCLLYTSIFSLATFYCIQLKKDFVTLLLFFFLNSYSYMHGLWLGLFLGTILNEQVVFAVSPFVFVIFMLGSGFYLSNDNFPVVFRWINYISPYKYFMELFLKSEASFNELTMQIPEMLGYKNGYTVCYTALMIMFAFFFIIEYPLLYKFAKKY